MPPWSVPDTWGYQYTMGDSGGFTAGSLARSPGAAGEQYPGSPTTADRRGLFRVNSGTGESGYGGEGVRDGGERGNQGGTYSGSCGRSQSPPMRGASYGDIFGQLPLNPAMSPGGCAPLGMPRIDETGFMNTMNPMRSAPAFNGRNVPYESEHPQHNVWSAQFASALGTRQGFIKPTYMQAAGGYPEGHTPSLKEEYEKKLAEQEKRAYTEIEDLRIRLNNSNIEYMKLKEEQKKREDEIIATTEKRCREEIEKELEPRIKEYCGQMSNQKESMNQMCQALTSDKRELERTCMRQREEMAKLRQVEQKANELESELARKHQLCNGLERKIEAIRSESHGELKRRDQIINELTVHNTRIQEGTGGYTPPPPRPAVLFQLDDNNNESSFKTVLPSSDGSGNAQDRKGTSEHQNEPMNVAGAMVDRIFEKYTDAGDGQAVRYGPNQGEGRIGPNQFLPVPAHGPYVETSAVAQPSIVDGRIIAPVRKSNPFDDDQDDQYLRPSARNGQRQGGEGPPGGEGSGGDPPNDGPRTRGDGGGGTPDRTISAIAEDERRKAMSGSKPPKIFDIKIIELPTPARREWWWTDTLTKIENAYPEDPIGVKNHYKQLINADELETADRMENKYPYVEVKINTILRELIKKCHNDALVAKVEELTEDCNSDHASRERLRSEHLLVLINKATMSQDPSLGAYDLQTLWQCKPKCRNAGQDGSGVKFIHWLELQAWMIAFSGILRRMKKRPDEDTLYTIFVKEGKIEQMKILEWDWKEHERLPQAQQTYEDMKGRIDRYIAKEEKRKNDQSRKAIGSINQPIRIPGVPGTFLEALDDDGMLKVGDADDVPAVPARHQQPRGRSRSLKRNQSFSRNRSWLSDGGTVHSPSGYRYNKSRTRQSPSGRNYKPRRFSKGGRAYFSKSPLGRRPRRSSNVTSRSRSAGGRSFSRNRRTPAAPVVNGVFVPGGFCKDFIEGKECAFMKKHGNCKFKHEHPTKADYERKGAPAAPASVTPSGGSERGTSTPENTSKDRQANSPSPKEDASKF